MFVTGQIFPRPWDSPEKPNFKLKVPFLPLNSLRTDTSTTLRTPSPTNGTIPSSAPANRTNSTPSPSMNKTINSDSSTTNTKKSFDRQLWKDSRYLLSTGFVQESWRGLCFNARQSRQCSMEIIRKIMSWLHRQLGPMSFIFGRKKGRIIRHSRTRMGSRSLGGSRRFRRDVRRSERRYRRKMRLNRWNKFGISKIEISWGRSWIRGMSRY